jgi:hypothetical protein
METTEMHIFFMNLILLIENRDFPHNDVLTLTWFKSRQGILTIYRIIVCQNFCENFRKWYQIAADEKSNFGTRSDVNLNPKHVVF